MTTETISTDLRAVLRRLKLSPMLDTLPERFTLARQQKMPHQDLLLLLLVLSDEVNRRDSRSATLRARKASLDAEMQLERWDETAEVTYDKKDKRIHIISGDDWKVKAVTEMLLIQCARLKVDPKCLDPLQIEPTSHGAVKTEILVKEGIPRETCQKMVKMIKGLKVKVQAAIQEDQVRLIGKKIDDLQEVMQLLRDEDYNLPLQFINMKS